MYGKRSVGTMVLALAATLGLLMMLAAFLPAAVGEAGEEGDYPFEDSGVEGIDAKTLPGEGTEPFAARLDSLSYYTIRVREPGGRVYYTGFAQSETPLTAWLGAIEEGGLSGEVVAMGFPAAPLALSEEAPEYLGELFLILNQQLRHLGRAADFFNHSWEEIAGQTVTARRLDLLREEAGELSEDLAGLAAYDSALRKLPACPKIETLLKEWQELLGELDTDTSGKSFWPAQEKVLELLGAWQSLLEEIGFVPRQG